MKFQLVQFKNFKATFIVIVFASIMAGCKKENTEMPPQSQVLTEENSDATVFKSTEGLSTTKLVLRPGPGNGQDVYVDGRDGAGSGNLNSIPELPVNEWTGGGQSITTRSFIKFVNLALIPEDSRIISAKLYFFGLPQSLNSPQGNSYYPGSPYNIYGDNTCLVQRVVGANWTESGLTFDNQPATTTTDQAMLAPSESQWNYNAEVDVTDIVKTMVANPSENYGFAIKLATEIKYRSIVFASSETTSRSLRPKLVIKFN